MPRVGAVVIERWCNWPDGLSYIIVILLLSSLWLIWNNCIYQLPASNTSMASNIRKRPSTPGLLYFLNFGGYELKVFKCLESAQICLVEPLQVATLRACLPSAGWRAACVTAANKLLNWWEKVICVTIILQSWKWENTMSAIISPSTETRPEHNQASFSYLLSAKYSPG